jgi:serine/threonine protein kinase
MDPRPCPFCGVAVAGSHEGCTGLFKEIMSTSSTSPLDEMPPEVQAIESDETRRLNDYLLVEQIGKGGMGTVWKAWDRKLTRWIAVKFLNGQDSDDFARFTREAKLAARLRHPNIAAVFDTGEVPSKQAGQESVRYLAMEYIEGQSVATADLPLRSWMEIFARVARAVDHAHKAGVIHRDIKPTNLMLTREHWPYVMDFGLAKSLKAGSSVSMSGVILGTPSFMPPEQAGGKTREIDERSDIYSLGATLYFVLTRQAPFQGDDSVDVIVKVLQTSPPRPRELRPDLPEGVEAVVLKAMARNKEERYATAGELAEDLEKLAEGQRPKAQPRSQASALAVVILSLVILVLVGWILKKPPPPPPPVQVQAPMEKPSPIPGFVVEFEKLTDSKRWRDAQALLEKAVYLSSEDHDKYAQKIGEGCKAESQHLTRTFCLELLKKLEAPVPGFKFETLGSRLQAPDQLMPDDTFQWTRDLLPKLDAGLPEALIEAARKAVAFDEAGDNPWFRVAEGAAYQTLLSKLREQTQRARGGRRKFVEECREVAETLAKPWDALLAGLPKHHRSLLDKHAAAIENERKNFPGDSDDLETLNIGDILNQPNAAKALQDAEQKLRTLYAVGNLNRESQHSLLVKLVTARALAGAIQEKSAKEIASGLQEFAQALKEVEGLGVEESPFGPKVTAVFRLLR